MFYTDHFITDKWAISLWAIICDMNFIEVLLNFRFAILAFLLSFYTFI